MSQHSNVRNSIVLHKCHTIAPYINNRNRLCILCIDTLPHSEYNYIITNLHLNYTVKCLLIFFVNNT